MKRQFLLSTLINASLVFTHSFVCGADIHDAVTANNLEHVKQILSNDPSLINATDELGRTPLHWACRGVHFEIVKFLVEEAADINAADVNGMVPLHNVASRGHKEAVRLLIEKGAHLDEQSIFDLGTPLHYAIQGGFKEVANLLLGSGARIDLMNNLEVSPLHIAVLDGQKEMLELLVDKTIENDPALLNLKDFDGNTVLHLACTKHDAKSVAYLVMKGADINARNTAGQTPYNLITENESEDLAYFLESSGADQSPQQFPILTGPYLGQTPPGKTPKLFAKGIVSTSQGMHGNIAFSPNLDEVVWTLKDTVYFMKMKSNTWSTPTKHTLFKENYSIDAPFFSFDNRRVYFVAGLRDTTQMMGNEIIWYIERQGAGWSEPQSFDSVVNSEPIHWQASMDKKGNVYTSGIFCAEFEDGKYTPREKLSDVINVIPDSIKYAGEVAPFVSPNGDYLIFNRFTPPPPQWRSSFLISFKGKEGEWTEPIELNDILNGNASIARVSPDGKYLFFLSSRPGSAKERSVYWIDASVIKELKPEGL